jgi:hypothetical protein
MEEMREKGAEVKYIKPNWMENYSVPPIPEIPKHKKTKKPPVPRRVEYGL